VETPFCHQQLSVPISVKKDYQLLIKATN